MQRSLWFEVRGQLSVVSRSARQPEPHHQPSTNLLAPRRRNPYKGGVKKTVAPASSASTSSASAISNGQRRYLYYTAAVTGGAIMIVEILGAKMLAPYVGTSHFVWTAQIAVTLVALAAGYYAGGRLVDRSPRLGHIYNGMLVAAVYLCLAVLVVKPVAYGCLHFRLALGSLLASTFLFFVPLSLLAMVGPFFIRVLTVSVSGVGGNVGRLTAVSTLGSFAGTMLIGYVLIPFLPNSVTMCLTAVLLMGLAVGYHLVWSRRRAVAPAVGAGVLLIGLVGMGGDAAPGSPLRKLGLGELAARVGWPTSEHRSRFAAMEELARCNSNFGLLQVLQDKDSTMRYYLNDYLWQNTYDTQEKKSISMFTYMLHDLARAYTPRIDQVLCVGLGVGIVPMEFAREGARVDVVEINPAVVPLAQKYFDLEPARLNLHFGDGRAFINRSDKQYDAVILDAFLGESSPAHLMTREAFAAMRRLLKPDGTLVINSFGDFEPGQDFFTASLYKTLANVFPSVRIHNDGRNGNTMFVASSRPNLEIVHPPDFAHVHPHCAQEVQAAFEGLRETNPRHGRVLTDDYNPVEFRDAANREELRRRLALSMKNL